MKPLKDLQFKRQSKDLECNENYEGTEFQYLNDLDGHLTYANCRNQYRVQGATSYQLVADKSQRKFTKIDTKTWRIQSSRLASVH